MERTNDIDDEWSNFISEENNDEDDDIVNYYNNVYHTNKLIDDNNESDTHTILHTKNNDIYPDTNDILSNNISHELTSPIASELYVSTKTKIAYLNTHINLNDVFWKIEILPYYKPANGIIKKQIKFNSETMEELDFILNKIKNEKYCEENIITHINNPMGRIKFKDIRKVSVGVCKKDIVSHRCKKKGAFYNCFVIIMRLNVKNTFKEFHIKIFNTGKIEIPGIQDEESFQTILSEIINTLQPHISINLNYKTNSTINVLINSNFNCGYFINRSVLYDILTEKYNIKCMYDPCSYPGIQCKFYYNPEIDIQSGSQISDKNNTLYKNSTIVSFMIFRTGSILIVGKCDEEVLHIIYKFLKNILTTEYTQICQKININATDNEYEFHKNIKVKKSRRKFIVVNSFNV